MNTATVSGEPSAAQTDTTNAENDPLLALTDLFSSATLDGREYVQVQMSQALAARLPTPQLNDDCCLALFGQFSLREQLQLRAVCRQWQAIIEQKCRRMRSLKIFGDVEIVVYYCENLMDFNLHDDDQWKLKPVGKDDDLIGSLDQLRQCAHLFANITSFVCYDYYYYSSSQFSPNLALIPDMFPLLTSLTLHIGSSPFHILNSLPHLTSLHLLCLPEDTVIPEDIPILHQLECFSLCDYLGPNITSLLRQLSPNLTRLMLSGVKLPVADLATVLTSNPSFVTSVTHLTFGYINIPNCDYPAFLDLVCTHMVNLVYLHFFYINLDSFPSLAKLHHLTGLYIDRFLVPGPISRHLPSVSSVKQLHLPFHPISTAALNLQTLFPAVEQIIISHEVEAVLEHSRQYMSQFRITCPVTFHKIDPESIMGRHREISQA